MYFLSLHMGGGCEIENAEKYCMDYEGCMEMLTTLENEFGDMIPLETSQDVIQRESSSALKYMKDR